MSKITEFSKASYKCSDVYCSILINLESEKLNDPTVDIIKKDIIEYAPTISINCYTRKELINSIIELVNSTKYKLKIIREVIPNAYDIGLIRCRDIKQPIEDLVSTFSKRYRYYIILTSEDNTILLTYNPEYKYIKDSVIKDGEKRITCKILQNNLINIIEKELPVVKTITETSGVLTIYEGGNE